MGSLKMIANSNSSSMISTREARNSTGKAFHFTFILCRSLTMAYRWLSKFASEGNGSLVEFARHSYKTFGLNVNKDGDLEYREWAPNAKEVSIVRIQL